MNVIALGGAGAMGRLAVRTLAACETVSGLTIADYDLEAAIALSGELGEKCAAIKIDANNHNEMVDAIRGNDVALGTIGPFYKYETKMARACIEAGVNYVLTYSDTIGNTNAWTTVGAAIGGDGSAIGPFQDAGATNAAGFYRIEATTAP